MIQINYSLKMKKMIVLCLISVGLLFSTKVMSQDITSGLFLHYDFDAVTGTDVPDVSGNGKNGALNGAASLVEAYSGQGVNMLVKADYIRLPADITVGLTSFTYATWVKFTDLKNVRRFFDFGNGADATNNFLAFVPSYNGDNQVMCLRYRPATGTAYNILSTAKIPVGSWAHVALTFKWDELTSTAAVKIYLNGADVTNYTATPSANSLIYNPSLSLGNTADNYLSYSRWTQDVNGFNGTIDDVRFYNRALTATDILTLNGMAELNKQWSNLNLGDLTGVTANLTLPTVLGSSGVTVRWTSSKSTVIDTLGNVTRPEKYDANVKLTATLMQIVSGKTYTMTKEFTAKVLGLIATPEQIAQWTFATDAITLENDTLRVIDIQSGFKGKLVNDAKIRTIGATEKYNVLDLGNGKGYFDMDKEIGKAIYSLSNYTIMGFFRVAEDYSELASSGNFLYAFSNTAVADVDRNGYLIGRLNNTSHQCTSGYWGNGKMEIAAGTAAPVGAWHHYAYVQNGTTGTIYIDGVQAATGTMTQLPSTSIALTDRNGTLFNWLGRSIGLASDVYLRKTLIYDFQLLSISVIPEDLNVIFEVSSTIDKLNNAFAENPDFIDPQLNAELENLSLGDLSQVTSDLTLPLKGVIDNTVTISWKSSNTSLIGNAGTVTRPMYYAYNVTLTATLLKNGQSVSKTFTASVVPVDGTQFANDLLVKYDFSTVQDSIVTDAAEKQFKGTLKNGANIKTIGNSTKYNVLNLGDSIGYFDMGPEIGKLMYNLSDFTISTYYRIDSAYHDINANGNFIWNFSNSANVMTDMNGYFIGSLKNQGISITPGYYTAATGNQTVAFATNSLTGGWHHIAYTQSAAVGTMYIDGMPLAIGDITNLPATALPKNGRLGTLYNWIGRSCYIGDAYLRKTMISDFRLYRKALTDEQIQASVLDVANKISALDIAYAESTTAVTKLIDSPYTIISTNGKIKISGLNSNEKVTVFDIAGRQIKFTNHTEITVNSGVYIVRVNNFITKVIVK